MTASRRPLTQEELEALKAKILERKQVLWTEVFEVLRNRIGEEYHDLLTTVRDEEDFAQLDLQEEIDLTAIQSRKEELEAIAQALWRMERGEYGKCLDCGRWIRWRRLEVRPWASYCTDCKEKKERRPGGP